MKSYKVICHFAVALLLLVLGGCSKIDDYKDLYATDGSIIYPGKMDSVKVLSGKNRVKITGIFTSDPKIVKYKVFWNSKQDSIEVPITRTAGVDTAKVFINKLPEGLMSFVIRSYDAQGHSSIPVNISGNVYGDLYQSSLINRAIANAELQKSDGSALINWADVDKEAGIINMRIKYTDNASIAKNVLVTSVPSGLKTSLPNFKAGNTISFQTSFLPNATAIDTFFVAYQTNNVKADVTSLYLRNTGPFERATFDGGRWGTLAAPWVVSANILNHGGFGGYASEPWLNRGGFLVMESGWGGTANIINGKIYQTATLPAGTYIFQVEDYTEANDPVYIVAAAGVGLPDISALSTALGSTAFSTRKNVQETIQFQFTLTQQQVVSLGFLATMTTGNQYWRSGSVRLIKN
jgi:hypothetical protein